MQADMVQAIRHVARLDLGKDETSADMPDDFGFYHPADTVFEVWLQRKIHHLLPDPGGWLDQTTAWRHDLSICDWLYNAAVGEIQSGFDGSELFNDGGDLPDMGRMFGA